MRKLELLRKVPEMIGEWELNVFGFYTRTNPNDKNMLWQVVSRTDGWHWYSIQWGTHSASASGDFGPYPTWEAAAKNCEKHFDE